MAGRRPAVSGRSGFPADGTAQVLAPLASARTFRAERPAFVWLAEREVLRFLKIWHFTIAGHVNYGLGVPPNQFHVPEAAGAGLVHV